MIHPKAIIEQGAILEEGVVVSGYAQIKANVIIGENTFVGPGAIIGEAPQMTGVKVNKGRVRIGKNNTIREYVTINSSTSPDKETCLGDNNYLMAFSHLAHDCQVANDVVICNGSLVAGHANIGDKAFISGNVVIHQFVRIGALVMVGGLSRVNQDIPPFMMVVGDSRVWGINLVGLRRAKFSRDEINQVKKAYNLLYRQNLALKTALKEIETIESVKVKELLVFILASKRGICGPKRSSFFEKLFLDYPYLLRNKIPTYDYFLKYRKR